MKGPKVGIEHTQSGIPNEGYSSSGNTLQVAGNSVGNKNSRQKKRKSSLLIQHRQNRSSLALDYSAGK